MAVQRLLKLKQPQIGQLIRDIRTLMELSQEQFANVLGVALPTVSRWENKRSQPSPLAMEKIQQKLEEMGSKGKDLRCKYCGE
ncbi:MAG TPA: helix-turn-helix transcriptional regulator [Nostocaceae cyanobacterium]|nr:helix-turn-helix transcriptional regulator [Nostocaceae cyanobacterium]